VLRRLFRPKGDEIMGNWRKLHNEELHNMSSPNAIRKNKSRRMRWAGHIAPMGEKDFGRKSRRKEISRIDMQVG
jgi:hypothetical protein